MLSLWRKSVKKSSENLSMGQIPKKGIYFFETLVMSLCLGLIHIIKNNLGFIKTFSKD